MSLYPRGTNAGRAGCDESRTSGSEGGPEKPTRRKTREGASVRPYTYLRVGRGWLYLVVFIDLFSRRVVGWALSSSLDHSIALRALQRAVAGRNPPAGLIIHSDRGVQYACTSFTKWLARHGFVQSMSRKGDCWDNAVVERFFRSLKSERTDHRLYRTREEARRDVIDYIEMFFNSRRKHSSLGYISPNEFEEFTMVA